MTVPPVSTAVDEAPHLERQRFDLRIVKVPQPGDQRQHDVREYGHLEQEDKGFANIMEERRQLPEAYPHRNSQSEPQNDLRRDTEARSFPDNNGHVRGKR